MDLRLSRWDAAALFGLMAFATLHALHFDHIADDAFISFRFAANFADGNGLVFNPGEYVMGYSNFLWVVLLGAAERLGMASPQAAPLLGIALGWGILALVYLHLRSSFGSRWAAIAGAGLLASNGTFALWLTGGLEGPLFALLLTASVVVALRIDASSPLGRFGQLGALLGLAALTRPEGVFYAGPIAAVLFLRQPDRARIRGLAVFLATALLIYALFTAWLYVYYGDPLPNPFYTKYHPISLELLSRGLLISGWFVEAYWGVPVIVVAAWAVFSRLRWSSPGWLPLAICAAFVVFFVRVGGDGQAYYRMWFWVLPMFALLLGEAVAEIGSGSTRALHAWAGGLLLMIAIANLQHSFIGGEIARVRSDEALARDVVRIATDLAEQHPGASVAANNVGVLAYVSRLEVVDMLGLTDRHIAKAARKSVGFPAHESHDGSYVLDRRPGVIFYGMPLAYARPQRLEQIFSLAYQSDRDLRADPRFKRDYRLEHLRLADGRVAPLFLRRRAAE